MSHESRLAARTVPLPGKLDLPDKSIEATKMVIVNGAMVPPKGGAPQDPSGSGVLNIPFRDEFAPEGQKAKEMQIRFSKDVGQKYDANKRDAYGKASDGSDIIFVKKVADCEYVLYIHLQIDIDAALNRGCKQADIQKFVNDLDNTIRKYFTKMKCQCKNKGKQKKPCVMSVKVLWSESSKGAGGDKPGTLTPDCTKKDKDKECGRAFRRFGGGAPAGLRVHTGSENADVEPEPCIAHELGHLLLTTTNDDHETDPDSFMNKRTYGKKLTNKTVCGIASNNGACDECCEKDEKGNIILASQDAAESPPTKKSGGPRIDEQPGLVYERRASGGDGQGDAVGLAPEEGSSR